MKKPVEKTIETSASTAQDSGATDKAAWLHDPYTWIGLSFVIFIALFIKYVSPTITKGLDARGDKIRDQLEQAERLRAEAEALLKSTKKKQKEMLKQAENIVATAQRDAISIRAQAAEDLKQALDRRTQQAKEKIARAEAEAIAQIRTRIVTLATDATRDMLTAQASSEHDEKAITRALTAIEQQVH